MLADARRRRVLAQLNDRGSVELTELTESLGVSEVTVRRDLAALESQGLLRRVRGGAILPQGAGYEPAFRVRQTTRHAAKEQIAACAERYVLDGDTLAIDVGTTTLALASRLAGRDNLTVLTPSLHIAATLAEHPTIRVILSGGVLRPRERSLIGDLAVQTLSQFTVDRLFLGVGGLHHERGLTEYSVDDTAVKRAMIAHAKDVTVLADSSKLGRVTFATVAPLEAVDRVVTDSQADAGDVEALRQHGVEVVVANPAIPPASEAGLGHDDHPSDAAVLSETAATGREAE